MFSQSVRLKLAYKQGINSLLVKELRKIKDHTCVILFAPTEAGKWEKIHNFKITTILIYYHFQKHYRQGLGWKLHQVRQNFLSPQNITCIISKEIFLHSLFRNASL